MTGAAPVAITDGIEVFPPEFGLPRPPVKDPKT